MTAVVVAITAAGMALGLYLGITGMMRARRLSKAEADLRRVFGDAKAEEMMDAARRASRG